MAQLDDPAAVVADDSTDSAAPAQTETQEATEVGSAELYPDEEPREQAEDASPDEGEEAPEGEDPDAGDDLPPVAPPHSWKAEEKEAFAQLPRELQETVARRQAEVDRFAQQKAQEAVQARTQAQQEALNELARISQTYAQQFEQVAQHLYVPEPDPMLQLDDPEAWAHQMRAHRQSEAQRYQTQQQAQRAQQEAQQAQQQIAAIEAQQLRETLQEKFPEYLDPNEGPKLQHELGSIALELGYPAELLREATATDILAIKEASSWRADAQKWRELQKRKMADVRAAKQLPRIAKPGAATVAKRAPKDTLEVLYPND